MTTADARNTAIQQFLADNAARAGRHDGNRPRFFITFQKKFKTTAHPVLGRIDVDAAVGLRADHYQQASDWARHWLGTRGFAKVLDNTAFLAAVADGVCPNGCPTMHVVPSARYFVSEKGARLIVWEDGTTDFYDVAGKRRAVPASVPANVTAAGLAASESWDEVWFSFDGEQLTPEQVAEVCARAGVES